MQMHATSEKSRNSSADSMHTRKQQPFFAPAFIQPTLMIGPVDDPYEREADAVADKVMRMPATKDSFFQPKPLTVTSVQRKCAACEQEELLQREEEKEERPVRLKPEKELDIQRKCTHCEKEDRKLQLEAVGGNIAGMTAPPVVHDVINSGGQPLDRSTRGFMEARFGYDFGDVQIHDDALAHQSSTSINAHAYTHGNHVVFAAGQYQPNTNFGRRLLAHELVHVVQQRNGVVNTSNILRSPDEPAGGCGLCYGMGPGKVGPRDAGTAAHKAIQKELISMSGGLVEEELPWGKGKIDVAIVRWISKEVAIAEIKPANEKGIDDGIKQIEERLRNQGKLKKYPGYKVVPLDPYYKIEKRIPFKTLAPVCNPPQPQGCNEQHLVVAGPVKGLLFLYFCEPSYKELVKKCTCECKEPKKKEPKKKEPKDSKSGPSHPELLTLGAKVAALLLADGLLSTALSFVGSLAVALTTPLLALAALAVGIVFLWDKIRSVAHMIASAAKFVWEKVSAILALVRDMLKEIGIKIGELAVWVGGLIKDIAEKIAEGLLAAGRGLVKGGKWLGGKIVSGAEAVWDWLFGSDPEPVALIIDLPVTEEPRHCVTTAKDDAIIKLDADTLFPFNERKLKPEANSPDYPPLKKAAATVRSMLLRSDDRVIINGYTDDVGGVDYNQLLSEQRAEAVRDWLVHYGHITSIIIIQGFGKSQAQGKDPQGRAKDRRVEIWVPKHGSVEKVCW